MARGRLWPRPPPFLVLEVARREQLLCRGPPAHPSVRPIQSRERGRGRASRLSARPRPSLPLSLPLPSLHPISFDARTLILFMHCDEWSMYIAYLALRRRHFHYLDGHLVGKRLKRVKRSGQGGGRGHRGYNLGSSLELFLQISEFLIYFHHKSNFMVRAGNLILNDINETLIANSLNLLITWSCERRVELVRDSGVREDLPT